MPLFNHAFTIAFSCVSEHPGNEVPAAELRAALHRHVESLNDADLESACGVAFNSFQVNAERDTSWEVHPTYPMSDWQAEAYVGGTRLGYWDWVLHKIESE